MDAGANIMNAAGALSVLDWWQMAGVDVEIDEAPRNWLAEKRQAVTALAPAAPAPQFSESEIIAPPQSLHAFQQWLATTENLPDGSVSHRRIMPVGTANAAFMILVDMPEIADAASGELLSDETGRLIQNMLATVGQKRDTVYLASLTLERPAGARIAPAALNAMGRLAHRHIAFAAPRRVLVMGEAACKAVLGEEIMPARGTIHHIKIEDIVIEAVATFAPRFLIQNPARKADAWKDLRLLAKGLRS